VVACGLPLPGWDQGIGYPLLFKVFAVVLAVTMFINIMFVGSLDLLSHDLRGPAAQQLTAVLSADDDSPTPLADVHPAATASVSASVPLLQVERAVAMVAAIPDDATLALAPPQLPPRQPTPQHQQLLLQQQQQQDIHSANSKRPMVVPGVHRVVPPITTPKFIKYLESCQKDPDEVRIRRWMGRSGNHLEQLVMAYAVALFSGRPFVATPTWFDDVWNLNWSVTSEVDLHTELAISRVAVLDPAAGPPVTSVPLSETCVEFRGLGADCVFVFDTRCATTVADRRDIFVRQIRPLLQPGVFSACEVPSPDTLVIHLRDGDASFDVGSSHAQPPCDYFHRVIETGNRGQSFDKVLLVHSHQYKMNVCVDDIKRRHASKLVGDDAETTILHDTCVCLQARNLAVTSSGFGVSLAMMNTAVDLLFVVDAVSSILGPDMPKLDPDAWNIFTLPRKIDDFELDAPQLCAVFPHAVHYFVPPEGTIVAVARKEGGRGKVDSDQNRMKYFLEFQKYATLVETDCSKSAPSLEK
jgi:hypothetical protein